MLTNEFVNIFRHSHDYERRLLSGIRGYFDEIGEGIFRLSNDNLVKLIEYEYGLAFYFRKEDANFGWFRVIWIVSEQCSEGKRFHSVLSGETHGLLFKLDRCVSKDAIPDRSEAVTAITAYFHEIKVFKNDVQYVG